MHRFDPDYRANRCRKCGSHVTPEFRRGYGDDEDRAHRCFNCDSRPRIDRGSAAGKSVPIADPLENPGRFGEPLNELPSAVQALCRPVATDGGERQ
ncbi:hypothetical protein C479_11255 [Halovivax asiaticus JCM 14624]|uniref:Small CPxCG-related zinc finger protein n=1 Tax=Halovivax asiaticus JCM 14624 TaxID=1227490 RepID=M0BGG3_9EURY|nr:hypothetical protein [Halovivax asiaticus]ELZ09393.1 hypothetical protein C479_11255 [Halovivax asiaticus JCM 14624]